MLSEPGNALPPLAELFAPLARYGRVGLAVSGGADSLALMLLYARWRSGPGPVPEAVVYTVDHQLRPEAQAEVEMVVREAGRLGLDARLLSWTGSKPGTGLQAEARAARYRLIAAAMAADGAEALATAHHRDDQAETVLMRLAHGSGLAGLAGMAGTSVVEGLTIVRPLLAVSPQSLRLVVAEAGLVAAHDPSNEDERYERVRWRKALAGLAALGLTPERLAMFARRAGEADAVVEAEAAGAFETLASAGDAGLTLDHAVLVALPASVGVKVLQRALGLVGGHGKPHALGDVEALLASLSPPRPLKTRTLHNCLIASDGRLLRFAREPGRNRNVVNPNGAAAV